jgi:hypothetical protein
MTVNRNDWKFFLDHAGYCTPPGRVVCAKEYAECERLASDLGYTFEWEWDDLPWDPGDMAGPPPKEVLGCVMKDPKGREVESLWGIGDPDRNYRRVVEAELASEHLAPMIRYAESVDYFLGRLAA